MTGIFSTITGQYAKSFVLGTFLPVLVFMVLFMQFVLPMLPTDFFVLRVFLGLSTPWPIVTLLFVTVVLAGLLGSLNNSIIRFYEGYSWKDGIVGRKRTKHYRLLSHGIQARKNGLRTLVFSYKTPVTEQYWAEISRQSRDGFPPEEKNILPTRFGNALRSFERYPDQQYRIESIVMFPRLLAVIDKEYAAKIDDAKISFDFMINSSFLNGLLAATLIIAGLFHPAPFSSILFFAPWMIKIIIFSGLAYGFYLLSFPRARSWGRTIEGAFDLYRLELLKQLGFQEAPWTLKEERKLWNRITQQISYGDSPLLRIWRYQEKVTHAEGKPYDVKLTVTRGLISFSKTQGDNNGSEFTIKLLISNKDKKRKRTVKDVIVTDSIPETAELIWDSPYLLKNGVHSQPDVDGVNPYRFHIGDLSHGEEAVLTYRIYVPGK